MKRGFFRYFFLFSTSHILRIWQVQDLVCQCWASKIYTIRIVYILLDYRLYFEIVYIHVYHTTTAVVVCYCVLCPYTAQCAQSHSSSALLPFPYHRPPWTTHHIYVNWKACLNSLLKTRQQNRASELAKHSGLPSTPAPRTTQCYFPRPLLYLRSAVAIAARSQDRKIGCAPCALRFLWRSRGAGRWEGKDAGLSSSLGDSTGSSLYISHYRHWAMKSSRRQERRRKRRRSVEKEWEHGGGVKLTEFASPQHCCCALFWTFTYGTYKERSPRCSTFPWALNALTSIYLVQRKNAPLLPRTLLWYRQARFYGSSAPLRIFRSW